MIANVSVRASTKIIYSEVAPYKRKDKRSGGSPKNLSRKDRIEAQHCVPWEVPRQCRCHDLRASAHYIDRVCHHIVSS